MLACGQSSTHDLNVAVLTLLGAIILFLISQYLLKFVFEPMSRVRRTLADISSTVLFNQAKITNGHADEQVAEEIRKLSAGLRAAVFEVRFYSLFAKICGVPSKENARRASHQLNLLSSGMNPMAHAATRSTNWADANTLALEELGDLLRIQTRY
jgi:hypothetical protein